MSGTDRRTEMRDFVARHVAEPFTIDVASADASFRSYWRVTRADGATRIVMDAPPDKENTAPWLDIGARLHAAGLHTPEVHASDLALGFVLMEDLGTALYLPALNADSVDALYGDALDALLRMQTRVDTSGLPKFDEAFMTVEMELMPEWFLRRHLGHAIECDEWDVIELAFRTVLNAAREQPQGFMHRDFHSRNLLVVDGSPDDAGDPPRLARPGIIDFQGAMIGPIAYDLASLLRDCYIRWDAERVDGWVEAHRLRLRNAHVIDAHTDAARFRRWFDLVGLQRHIKVLGLFCRLWYRDGKRHYLDDLPLVWDYVRTVAQRYPELAPMAALIERVLGERDITQPNESAA